MGTLARQEEIDVWVTVQVPGVFPQGSGVITPGKCFRLYMMIPVI